MEHGEIQHREPPRDGYEQDVVEGAWRRIYTWTKRPGATAYNKRKIRRRERAKAKRDIRRRMEQM